MGGGWGGGGGIVVTGGVGSGSVNYGGWTRGGWRLVAVVVDVVDVDTREFGNGIRYQRRSCLTCSR